MSDFVETAEHGAGKRMGPLPVWGWGLVLGLLIVAVMWYRSRAGSTATTATGGAVDPNAFDNAALYSGNNANASNATRATNSQANAVARTNTAWLRQGVQYETGKGRNGLWTLRALQKYLTGASLSQDQSDLVADVIKHVGVPPKPPAKMSPIKHPKTPAPSGGGETPPPDQTPPTKPPRRVISMTPVQDMPEVTPRTAMQSIPSHSTFTAADGESPASVAQQTYGASTPAHVAAIVRANPIGTTDTFKPGTIVKVPTYV